VGGLTEITIMSMFRLLSASALALFLLAGPALADASTTVDLGPLWGALLPTIETVLGSVAFVIVAFLAKKAHEWFGVSIDQKYQDSLHRAIETGINGALAKFGSKLNDVTVDAKSAVIADAVNWVIRSVPDAVARLNAGDKLANLVTSKLEAILDLPSVPYVSSATPTPDPAAPAA
jgi:hypothetical protein